MEAVEIMVVWLAVSGLIASVLGFVLMHASLVVYIAVSGLSALVIGKIINWSNGK